LNKYPVYIAALFVRSSKGTKKKAPSSVGFRDLYWSELSLWRKTEDILHPISLTSADGSGGQRRSVSPALRRDHKRLARQRLEAGCDMWSVLKSRPQAKRCAS
jgi:hypothetical protein